MIRILVYDEPNRQMRGRGLQSPKEGGCRKRTGTEPWGRAVQRGPVRIRRTGPKTAKGCALDVKWMRWTPQTLPQHTEANVPSESIPWPFSVSSSQSYATLFAWQHGAEPCSISPLSLNPCHCKTCVTWLIAFMHAGLLCFLSPGLPLLRPLLANCFTSFRRQFEERTRSSERPLNRCKRESQRKIRKRALDWSRERGTAKPSASVHMCEPNGDVLL